MIRNTGLVLLENYAKSHRSQGNKITHFIGIPLIVLSTFGFLNSLPNARFLALAGMIVFYFFHFRIYAFPFLLMLGAFGVLSSAISLTAHGIIFIIGWGFQLVGHYFYEKKSPSFFGNLAHLFIGPFFLFYLSLGMIRVWSNNLIKKPNY